MVVRISGSDYPLVKLVGKCRQSQAIPGLSTDKDYVVIHILSILCGHIKPIYDNFNAINVPSKNHEKAYLK